MPATPIEWIEIGDFSPGIIADRHGYAGGLSGTAPDNASAAGYGANGAATSDLTVGCMADASGALCPLPVGVLLSDRPASYFSATDSSSPEYFPADREHIFLLDAVLIPAIYEDVDPRTKVFAMYGAYFDPNGANSYRQLVWGVLAGLHSGDTDWSTIHWNSYDPGVAVDNTGPYAVMSGNAMLTRSIDGDRDADEYLEYGLTSVQNSLVFMFHSNPNAFNDENTSWASGAIPGDEQAMTNYNTTVGTNYPVSADAGASACVGTWPDPLAVAAGTSNAVSRYISDIPGFLAIAHQGRIVMASHASRRFGNVNVNIYSLIDRLYYSPPYNPSLCAALTSPATTYGPPHYETSIAGDENIAPIGVLASLTASELLIVKWAGGGVLMRGDMDNFEAIAMPFIESTYGVRHHGVGTPMGFAYGSRNGVFVWPHGSETTEKISKQLPGFFWNHAVIDSDTGEQIPYVGNRGRFAWWNPYLCVPNNFLYNAEGKSWWRLDDAGTLAVEPFSVYQVDPANGHLIAFPYRYNPGVTLKWAEYDQDILRSNYSWQSHPLVETREVEFNVKEVEVTLSQAEPFAGGHTVTVTCIGLNWEGTSVAARALTFTPDSGGQLQIMRDQVHNNADASLQGTFQCKYLQLRVAVTGGSGPAPKIHKLRVGVVPTGRRGPRAA